MRNGRDTRKIRDPNDRNYHQFKALQPVINALKTKTEQKNQIGCSTNQPCTTSDVPPILSGNLRAVFYWLQFAGSVFLFYFFFCRLLNLSSCEVSPVRPETRFIACLYLLSCKISLADSSGITHQCSGGEWKAEKDQRMQGITCATECIWV